MTASSSCSGAVDNFWSRDDIRVHTFGGSPKAVEVLAEGSVRGQADPHRRREASRERKRRGSPSLRAMSSRRNGSRGSAPWRGSGRQNAHDMERHIRMVADAVNVQTARSTASQIAST
jgi:hypothetical protein